MFGEFNSNRLLTRNSKIVRPRGFSRLDSLLWQVGAILIIIAILTPAANCELATPVEMENVSRNHLSEMVYRHGSWAGSTTPEVIGVHEIRQDGVLLAHYYDVSPRGYVVVPVLKEMPPVKMYSDESNLGPEQEEGALQLLKEVLSSRLQAYEATYGNLNVVQPDGGGMYDRSHKVKWNQLAVSAKEFRVDQSLSTTDQAGPLITSVWHQRAPYYNNCPMGDGGRCVVGCVATSASQIMDYWEWPLSGVGSHEYYWEGDDCNGGSVQGLFLSADFTHSYDWANIPDDCDGGCSPAEEAALAELSSDVGIALNMNYGACGSGTWLYMNIFTDYFRYSSDIDREDRDNHSQASWFALIQEEIDAGRPIWYCINSHAIVCDGWRDDTQMEYHMNYGWGGGHNAWYVLDNLYCYWIEGDICPYEQDFMIRKIEPLLDPLLVYTGSNLDDAAGNGDGHADAGETILLDVTIKNNGDDAANTAGVLSTSDAYVSFVTATSTFDATIPWGGESSTLTPFELEISLSCPDPHIVEFNLDIFADGGFSTIETFYLYVGSTPGFADDTESGEGYWTHFPFINTFTDQWHLETHRANSGTSSWKYGGAGETDYADGSDGALITQPFLLSPDADLSFYHWIDAEVGTGPTAWDGSIVMISSSDGQWSQITPEGGYPYTIIDNDASPFEAETPCFSGTYSWQKESFDLSAYSGVVQLMFRFGSDGATTQEGWYVDDILVCNTDIGTSVAVNLLDDAAVTFDQVVTPGETLAEIVTTGPAIPAGYLAVPPDPCKYFEITSDAGWTGSVEICLDYDETAVTGSEANLVLFHYDGGEWVDVTTSIDIEANQICGSSTSLSTFVIAERISCCVGMVGDANGMGGDIPTIGDISTLIDAKFITGVCVVDEGLPTEVKIVACLEEGDVNQSATSVPTCNDITISDISMLIDYLFITGPEFYGPLLDCL